MRLKMLKYKLTKNLTENQIDKIKKDKRVKVVFKEPFATIENFVKLAKKEIAEVGFAEFKSAIISSKDKCVESIKKEPLGSDCNRSSCFKWRNFTYGLTLQTLKIIPIFELI